MKAPHATLVTLAAPCWSSSWEPPLRWAPCAICSRHDQGLEDRFHELPQREFRPLRYERRRDKAAQADRLEESHAAGVVA